MKFIFLRFRIFFIFLAILLFTLGGVFIFLFIGNTKQAEHITWGATFGHSQAESLGLNWREAYLALVDDMGVRRFRIPIYWDELEKEKGKFDFSAWDWQLQELEKRGGKAFLAIGMKLPRWPECRIPEWAKDLSKEDREKEILAMLSVVVEHFKDNPAVWAWQVENEPVLRFGNCPEPRIEKRFLDQEIALVRKADPSRPIILSDTGENSFWLQTGKRADIFSSTLFRIIHNPTIGYVRYPYPPIMYHRKAAWLHIWYPNVRIIVGELQAEPWVVKPPISQYSVEEQYETMSPEQFSNNIEYAKNTGFDEFYLWGSEWWYWLKTHGETDIWQKARELFHSKN